MKKLRLALAALALVSVSAFAQTYPARAIRMVVPFPPGGGFDGIARPFAERLGQVLGQPVVVDNRPGAGGNIGAEQVAKSPADGYTLLFANDFMGTNPNLYKEIHYDPVKDFAWADEPGAPGVRRKLLGVFSARKTRISILGLEAGATATLAPNAIAFVMSGRGSAAGKEWRAHATLRTGEEAQSLRATEASEVLELHIPHLNLA